MRVHESTARTADAHIPYQLGEAVHGLLDMSELLKHPSNRIPFLTLGG
jgi:hypothetical protein